MKRKFLAFSISLVLMLLIFFGPRHPGAGVAPIPTFRRPASGITSTERGEPALIVVGTPLRLRSGWPWGCGEELAIEDQVNCALYFLNHPGQWLDR